MNVRAIRKSDLPELLRIEQGAMSAPWNEEQLAGEMDAVNGVGLLIERNTQVCGYAFFRTCMPETELLRLAVAPEQRRQGMASVLLEHAFHSFSGQGYETCFLEVRHSNEEARRLYQKIGFLQVGIRKKYYSQPVEDALQLCRNLIDMRGWNH